MTRTHSVLTLLAIVAAVVLAGCGSSSSADKGNGTVVSVGRLYQTDPIVTNAKGITLYEYRKDKGTRSECYDGNGCAKAILPLLTNGAPRAKGGAIPSKLGTTERKDGTTQVTYAGHPLYFWHDEIPGQARGWGVKAFNARWYPLRPSGKAVEGA